MTNQIAGWIHLNYTSSRKVATRSQGEEDRTLNRESWGQSTELRVRAVLVFVNGGVNFFLICWERIKYQGFYKESTANKSVI